MSELFDIHISLVIAVNELNGTERTHATHRLLGFRDALNAMGINQLTQCDLYYIEKGIDVPMCCGVFLTE